MKKLVLILMFLFSISLSVYAQSSEIEAIAAYQMAEENFDVKNYEAALKHINTTKTILGTANSKILYLEVQILEELSQANREYLKDLQFAIHAFEQAPDIDLFSQEKRVEVAKIKMRVGDRVNQIEKAIYEAEQLALLKENAGRQFRDGLPNPGIHIDEFLNNPYVRKYKKMLSPKQKKRLLKGKFVWLLLPLDEEQENERFVRYISTDKNGMVARYTMYVQVNDEDSFESAIAEVFGVDGQGKVDKNNGVLTLIIEDKTVEIENKISRGHGERMGRTVSFPCLEFVVKPHKKV